MSNQSKILLLAEPERAWDVGNLLLGLGYAQPQSACERADWNLLLKQQEVDLALIDLALAEKLSCLDETQRYCQEEGFPLVYLTGEDLGGRGVYETISLPVAKRELQLVAHYWLENPVKKQNAVKGAFETLFGLLPVGVAVLDTSREIILSNPKMAQILRLDRAEVTYEKLISRPFLRSDGSRRPPEEYAAYRSVIGREELQHFETGMVTESGETVWLDIHALPVSFADWSAILVVSDISEQKTAREQLRLQGVALESASNGIMITDRDGKIEWVNRAFTSIIGYSQAEAVGQTMRLLNSGKHPVPFYTKMWNAILAGETWHGILMDRHKNGEVIPVEEFISPVKNLAGEISHFVVIMTNLEGRIHDREQIHLQSAALEAAANAIVITDPQGNIEWVNHAFTLLTGYSPEDAIGQHTRLLKSEIHSRHFYSNLWETILAGQVWRGELVNRRKNGEQYDEEMTITPVMNLDNEIIHFIAIKQDISLRVRIEGELRQYAREQEALHLVAAASTAQHDPIELANTILDVILGIPGLSAASGWVMLVNSQTKKMEVQAVRNLSQRFIDAELNHGVETCATCGLIQSRQQSGVFVHPLDECQRIPKAVIQAEGLQTKVSIPLIIDDEMLGVLNLAWKAPYQYSENNASVLESIGKQVSLALHRARLYDEAAQADQLKIINQIGSEMNASIELEQVFQNMLVLACQALGGGEGSVLLVDPETGDLVFQETLAQHPERLRGQKLTKGLGLAGWAIEHRQTVVSNHVHSDPRWNHKADETTGVYTDSVLCAPLVHSGDVIGVIEVVNSVRGGFTEKDASLLNAIAPMAAIAIKNAQLFSATRRRAAELDTLNHIGTAIISALDSRAIIRAALDRIAVQFEAIYVGLLRLEPDGQTVILEHALFDGKPVSVPNRLPLAQVVAAPAIRERRSILQPSMLDLPHLDSAMRSLIQDQIHGLMVAPLLVAGHVFGALEVASDAPGKYTENDLRVLEAVAANMSVALENARLYEETRQLLVEREQAQAQLIQSEKIAGLGRMAATVAHEINNPLQAVQGCLGLFSEEMDGRNRPEKLKRYLGMVESEIARIAAIVRRMRDFYRPSTGGMRPSDLSLVITEVLELSAKQLQNNNVLVETAWDANLPFVLANADHLKQVFINLVLNAIDAMPEGGTLRIQIETLADAQPAPMLKITFSDTGAGMSPEVMSRLYEPFFTTKEHGTGLGLYVTAGIIQSHSGKIEISSYPGLGTSFYIFLPVATQLNQKDAGL